MPSLYFEDFTPGSATPYGSITVEHDPMLAFARTYDAQPMHIDAEAAKTTMPGELIASGWYTAALNMRMMADDFILDTASMGSPGVSELKWLKPVKAGDTLRGMRNVLDRRPSQSKPDRGFVNFRTQLFNQRNEMVLEQTNLVMIGRRGRQALDDPTTPTQANLPPQPPAMVDREFDTIPFFEELSLGERLNLGAVTFTESDIIAFARDFDPQSFHIDPVAATSSNFGGLIASGWHTGSAWMGQMVRNRTAAAVNAVQRGNRPARLGPSPGFQHLRWIKPVYAGDTIRYTSAIFEKRLSASRPEWGIVRHYNTGVNQKDETVFCFIGSVFWERRSQP